MSDAFDPRVTPWREDLAAAELEGVRSAERYAERTPMRCRVDVASLRRDPAALAEQVDQLLWGERFDVLETRDGWAWGQARRDGYVGWVREASLDETATRPTHRVSALATATLLMPQVKARAAFVLPMNALVTAEETLGRFVKCRDAGVIHEAHLEPIGGGFETDVAGVAERFLGAPYLWSGRTAQGIDCSGLVQAALYACGRSCPRDSDQQEAALGCALMQEEPPRRGDLAFWGGHVGVMLDAETLLHANAHHMAVVREPLAIAAERQPAAPRLRRL